jgi:SnoaL-like domain
VTDRHSGWDDGPLGTFITSYLERVVNQQDLTAVDDMVSSDYVGSGHEWPTHIEELRRFYRDQMHDRPDWHTDVQGTVELGDSVVARARASGTVAVDGRPRRKRLEWLAHYRVVDRRITEINILAVVPLSLD